MPRGEGTKKLVDLFAKYKQTLRAPEQSVRIAVVEVIEDLLAIKVPETKLTYSPHTRLITVKAAGLLRSEILLHKKEILAHVKGRLGEKNAPYDII